MSPIFRRCHWPKCKQEAFFIRIKNENTITALCREHFDLVEKAREP